MSWLFEYLKTFLLLHDDILAEYYVSILEDAELPREEKFDIIRESLRESGSPVLTSDEKIQEAVTEIASKYHIKREENVHDIISRTPAFNPLAKEFVPSLNPEAQEFIPSLTPAPKDYKTCLQIHPVIYEEQKIETIALHHSFGNLSFKNSEDFNENDWIEPLEEESALYPNMSPTELLHEVFTDIDPDLLIKIFEQNNFDLECTLNSLLNLKSESAEQKNQGKQMCRFFLEGNCLRKDCLYSHELQNVVCKFWMRGKCIAGDSCAFVHDIDISKFKDVFATNNTHPKYNLKIPDTFDKSTFPDLSSKLATKKISFSSPSQFANIIKRRRLAEQLPWIDIKLIDSRLKAYENKMEITAATLKKEYPRPDNFIITKPTATKPTRSQRSLVVKPPEHIPWLVTGSALSADYKKYRSQAIMCGRTRNALYERASNSYKVNRGDLAKKYSLEAQEYNIRMRELNREASRQIFNARNKEYGKEPFIDLHGLHVDEAVEFLEESFEALENEDYKGLVYIVTGTGHHSQNMKAKLGPAVQEWLEEWDYEYCDCSRDKRYGGMLCVEIQ
ncbi:hypothetical protein G9A89_013914 [Geosiphon pyriformis]|nr:hypothetical protein G9A89_013914 [Geosiphon pyriformis]